MTGRRPATLRVLKMHAQRLCDAIDDETIEDEADRFEKILFGLTDVLQASPAFVLEGLRKFGPSPTSWYYLMKIGEIDLALSEFEASIASSGGVSEQTDFDELESFTRELSKHPVSDAQSAHLVKIKNMIGKLNR